jgi:hypothetical protein
MILHWLDVELWGPMWPNIFSPNIWTLVALALHLAATLLQRARHHRDSEQRADERHEDLKRHVTDTANANESEAK